MIRVNLMEINPSNGINKIVEMSAVPRIGDDIEVECDAGTFQVRTVIWTPGQGREYDVQVRFR